MQARTPAAHNGDKATRFVALLFLLLCLACSGNSPNAAEAIGGHLDLTGWLPGDDGLYPLNGEWQFCPEALIEPSEIGSEREAQRCSTTSRVPDQWERGNARLPGGSLGVATYVLKLSGIPVTDPLELGVGVEGVGTAYRLYLVTERETRLLLSRGTVARERNEAVPEFGHSLVGLGDIPSSVILVWQISNHHHYRSGPRRALRLGYLQDLVWQEKTKTHSAFFVFGLLAIMGLYQFLTFGLHRAFRGGLWLAVLCGTMLLRHLATEGYIGGHLDDDLRLIFAVRMKVEYVSYFIAVPAFVSFMHALFPYRRPELVHRIVWGVSGLFCLIALLTTPVFYGRLLPLYQAFSVGVILWIGGYIARAALSGNRWALSSFVGFLVLGFCALIDMASSAGYADVTSLSMYGMAVFILTQAYVLAGQFTEAHETAERLTGHLSEEVDKKTQALQLETTRAREQQVVAEEAKAQVERLDHEKTAFFQNLSHDFRTPLTLILNVFGKLERELPEHRAVAMGQRNTKRLAKLVDELLDYQKIEGGHGTVRLADVSIYESMQGIQAYFDDTFEQRGLTFSWSVPDGWGPDENHVRVRADAEALERVLVNFVANAMKHTETGGSIRLYAETIGTFARLQVSDTGTGIAQGDQAAIFEPFVQARDRAGLGGTGLGLALCKKLAEEMGGRVGVESTLGEGSTFWIDLALVEQS